MLVTMKKALIFAAGLGTRLYPLTKDKPKALVEINKIPLIDLAIRKLKKHGFNDITVNIHHFAEKLKKHLLKYNSTDVNISISDETDKLLDTGGGLLKASRIMKDNKPILIYNVDIITDLDLSELYDFHNKNKALATLAVQERKSNRSLLFNQENLLCGWQNTETKEKIISRKYTEINKKNFSGIHIIDPKLPEMITEKGKFSIIKTYLRLSATEKIQAFNHNSKWIDAGTKENLKKAEQNFLKFKF